MGGSRERSRFELTKTNFDVEADVANVTGRKAFLVKGKKAYLL